MPSSPGFRGGKKEDRSTGLHSMAEIMDGLMQRREIAKGIPIGHLATRWEDVVGPKLAAVSAPAKLEQGTLTVAAETNAWSAQLGFLRDEIRHAANELLGREEVHRVQVTVAPPPGPSTT